jgi:protein associated with RNAse G/E
MPPEIITVRSRKYDNEVRKTWTCELLEATDGLISAVGVFEIDVKHPGLGSISRGTISYEYFWLDRWYNVFRFHEPNGAFRSYYCNITMPPTLADGFLDYIDLDIDVVVGKDLSCEVLDMDDFEKNGIKYGYPSDVIDRANKSLDELMEHIGTSQFPFDPHL